MGSGTADSIADFVRLFTDLTGERISYKPFHDRLSTPAFPKFMRKLYESLMSDFIGTQLQVREGAMAMFDDIWVQDGSSFALNDRLAQSFRGRFTRISPAAAEVHCTYSLFTGQAINVSVAPDCEAERHFLPDPEEVSGKLILLDRGYVSYEYFNELNISGGHYICRAKDSMMNPMIVQRLDCKTRIKTWEGKKFRDVHLPKNKSVDLIVQGIYRSKKLTLRLVAYWSPKAKRHVFFFTNLSVDKFRPEDVASIYKLRWQVELLFKECKSFSKLKKFRTADPNIAEGFIWASMISVLMRRFLTHKAHEAVGTRSAQFIAASVSWLFFREIGKAALRGSSHRFRVAVSETLDLLRTVALRTNPHRRSIFEELHIEVAHASS